MQKSFCDDLSSPKDCLNKLVAIVKKNNRNANAKLLERAFFFSKNAHEGQLRISKKPYFFHPLETAFILAEMGLSSEVVAAGLLHDVLEDTDVKEKGFKKAFGKEVFYLVDSVTKFKHLTSESREQSNLKNLQNLLFATTKDPRVILIKLADKLHNFRTMKYLKPKDRKRIASEALLIYIPIAHKIGLMKLASELEDLAFKYAKPETFERYKSKLRSLSRSKNHELDLMISVLNKKIPKAEFYKRQRNAYSIYTKLQNTGKTLDELHDNIILNVVVPDEEACYCALGLIHTVFRPLPNKFKDFIAVPKP